MIASPATNTGERTRPVRDGLLHHDLITAPHEDQSRAGLPRSAVAVLAGVARRHIARVGIEVIEQFIEEALHDALRAGTADRRRGNDRGARPDRSPPWPNPGCRHRREVSSSPDAVPGYKAKFAVAQLGGQVRIECGQPAQSPHRQLRGWNRFKCARCHEGKGCGVDIGRPEAGRIQPRQRAVRHARVRRATGTAGR